MARLLIKLENGADGEIELLNNKFIEFWKMVFLRHKSHIPFRHSDRKEKYCGHKHQVWDLTQEQVKNYYDTETVLELKQKLVNRVNTAIDGLHEENIQWTRGKLDIHCNKADCNRLHRGFTTLSFTHLWTDNIPMTSGQIRSIKNRYLNMNSHNCWPYQFEALPGFELPPSSRPITKDGGYAKKVKKCYEYLHEINAAVHNIEDKCLYNPRREILRQHYYNFYDVQCMLTPNLDWNAKLEDGVTDSMHLDWNFESALNQAFASVVPGIKQGCNVWDLKNILGKDYETCYRDSDNPVNLDITNTVGTTKGGFTINAAYKNLYDTILEPWLESFGKVEHKAMYFPIPVGKIDERFIKQHFTIKGGYDQGEQIKSKMIPGDEIHGVASERAIVEVDLIE